MKNTNDIKGVFYFLLLFICMCIIITPAFIILWYFPFLSNIFKDILENTTDGASLGLAVFLGIYFYIILFLRFIIMIYASIHIIRKSSNKILIKLFDNLKIPSLILIWLLLNDIIIKVYFKEWAVIHYDYFFSYSPFANFLPIYLVAVVNNIRLFINAKKTHK